MSLPVTAPPFDPASFPDLSGREVVTVVVFGDSGVAETFGPVAEAAAKACYEGREHRCDLGLMLGDNVYPSGFTTPAGPEWVAAFATPMAPFVPHATSDERFRVWVTAGNHDWNHDVEEAGRARVQAAIDTTASAANARIGGMWQQPALAWAVPGLPSWLHLHAVDSQTVVASAGGEVLAATRAALKATTDPGWDVIFAHHVPATTGGHGRDEDEKDDEVWAAALDLLRADGLDLVLAGHDHHQEVLETAGLPVVIAGSSSKGRDVVETKYAPCSRWSRAGTTGLGFLIVTFRKESATLQFYDAYGNVVHERPLTASGLAADERHVGSCL